MPESSLPSDIRDIYQDMWANNGDAISRQYAGTAAMKVKFVRSSSVSVPMLWLASDHTAIMTELSRTISNAPVKKGILNKASTIECYESSDG